MSSNLHLPLRCPCGFESEVPASFMGKTLRCPQCGRTLTLPMLRVTQILRKIEEDPRLRRRIGWDLARRLRRWMILSGSFLLVMLLVGIHTVFRWGWDEAEARARREIERLLRTLEREREKYTQSESQIPRLVETGGFAPGVFYPVERVIDGDTIVIEGKTIRLLGVDTPEMKTPEGGPEYFGPQATAFTQKMLEGQKVRLEFEDRTRDRFGRLLAYVYLTDGSCFNEILVRWGYARCFREHKFGRREEFLRYEEEAQALRRGMWFKLGMRDRR